MHRQGLLIRTARGVYRLAGSDNDEHSSLAEVCKRVPKGVVCLISALHYHQLGTQMPGEVWLAIDNKAQRPKIDYPPLHIVRFSGDALSEGVERHPSAGGEVRVYSIAKTVCDCFKFRNKIGLDVALEALRDAWQTKRVTMDELWHFAKLLRQANVMRPYLESLV